MDFKLNIISDELLKKYCSEFDSSLFQKFNELKDSDLSLENFSFYTSVSAVFSSKIEGEEIDLDSFIKHKRFEIEYQKDYTKKIDDLYDAYTFAQTNALNASSILAAHQLITKNILPVSKQGKIRNINMYVLTDEGKIEYVAALPSELEQEMTKFYHDLNVLLKLKLNFAQIFYFASMLHLVFVKIHPFNDGNGRTARLIEKWFLATMLGEKAWFVNSEKNYYENHAYYYQSIRALGIEYDDLNYSKALNFLNILAESLR